MAISLAPRGAPVALDQMNGRQKAAVLCMVLGAEGAAAVTQKLSPEEVEMISFEIARMERVDSMIAEAVLGEWMGLMQAADSLASGGLDYAREMLEKAYGPQKAQAMLKRIQSQLEDKAGLTRLRNADPQQLSSTMRGEHPQTIALILAHLAPAHAAAVLEGFETGLGGEVLFRMARMEKVSPDMLALIEKSILMDTDLSAAQGLSSSGGPTVVAAVLNLIPSSLEKELMEGVNSRDAALCEAIRNLMFVFEDIRGIDSRSVQRLLQDVEGKTLAVALKGASAELKEKIMAAMSARARDGLEEELSMLGPTKKRDIEAAQMEIVGTIRRLEEAGDIVVGGGTDDVVL